MFEGINLILINLSTNLFIELSTVYISHLTVDETQERSLLNLVHFISTYGLRPKLDLLCQVEINNAGGLHNWIPEVLMKIDTVILLLTKKYVEVRFFYINGGECFFYAYSLYGNQHSPA